MAVHRRIRDFIEQSGMSLETIAQKAEMSVEGLRAILNGEQTLYADDLRVVCLALNVSPEAFMDP